MLTLRKVSEYGFFFWSTFSRIWTEYWDLLLISPNSVQIRKNADQKKLEFGHFSRSEIDGYANNPENYSTTKIGEHISFRYSLSTIWVFDHTENKHISYCGKDCMKKFCSILRQYAKHIIDFKKKMKN